jgi:hypothetical protein
MIKKGGKTTTAFQKEIWHHGKQIMLTGKHTIMQHSPQISISQQSIFREFTLSVANFCPVP